MAGEKSNRVGFVMGQREVRWARGERGEGVGRG